MLAVYILSTSVWKLFFGPSLIVTVHATTMKRIQMQYTRGTGRGRKVEQKGKWSHQPNSSRERCGSASGSPDTTLQVSELTISRIRQETPPFRKKNLGFRSSVQDPSRTGRLVCIFAILVVKNKNFDARRRRAKIFGV